MTIIVPEAGRAATALPPVLMLVLMLVLVLVLVLTLALAWLHPPAR